jgi:hypothetical protein
MEVNVWGKAGGEAAAHRKAADEENWSEVAAFVGVQEEGAAAGKNPSSSWRPWFREEVDEEEEGTTVLFYRSSELENGHGDGGGR